MVRQAIQVNVVFIPFLCKASFDLLFAVALRGYLPHVERHAERSDLTKLFRVEEVFNDVSLTAFTIDLDVNLVRLGQVFAEPVARPGELTHRAVLWIDV